MKNSIATLAVLGTVLGLLPSGEAQASGILAKRLEANLRMHRVDIPALVVGTATITATNGQQGLIYTDSVPNPTSEFVGTTSIAFMPYPAAVTVRFADAGAASTPACASVVVTGFDQFGNRAAESFSTVDETAGGQTGNIAFSEVTRIEGFTCTGSDTSDIFIATASAKVGVERRIKSIDDIMRVCSYARGATGLFPVCLEHDDLVLVGSHLGATDPRAPVDLTYSTIDLAFLDSWVGGAFGDESVVWIDVMAADY